MALSLLTRPRLWPSSLFKRKSQGPPNNKFASLECQIDTPPIVVLRDGNDQDGSAISASLLFNIIKDDIDVESLHAVLRVHVVHKRPFKSRCKGCKHQITELKRCQFIETTTRLKSNTHRFPFSYQVPSYVPPSMDTAIVSVSYEFEAIAFFRQPDQISKAPRIITLKRILSVVRSIPVPSPISYSSRIFQASGIEVGCNFGSIMDPNTHNNASLTVSGLASCLGPGGDMQLWRLVKGSWMIQETVKTVALACTRHAQENGFIREAKSITQEKTSVLGSAAFYEGWNTDDDAGTLEMEFPFLIKKGMHKLPRHTQDTGDVGDTSVTHALVVELILVKEHYLKDRPGQAIRTGVGRILQSEHMVALSDYIRPSAGFAAQSLPCYQDLWPEPPVYQEEDV
ncbi:hypothetical protein F66182_5500 [Fusarium sp. NRRL 66182]|nr:hypothetical protein F66182_5500 [Fusarium sp. NRRL 66182]